MYKRQDLDVAGDITYDEITGRNLNITGVSTLTSTAQVGSGITLSPDGDVFATGVTTSTSFVGDLTGDVTGNVTGDVTGTATNATNITLADESSDTTCNVLFATGATGNLPAKTGTNLTFNSNTGDLAATSATFDHTFVGSAVTVSESGINAVGIITATSFNDMNGVGISTANVRTGILDVAGIATFRSNTLVGSGITLSPDGHAFVAGIATVGRQIVGISTNNLVPFLFNNYSNLPSASDYHGQFAHVHVAGKAFYAHAGAWYELVNKTLDHTVGVGTEQFNVGIITAQTFVGGGNTDGRFVTSKWVVGNNSNNHFTFTGPGWLSSADDPTIYIARGQTYQFDMSASGHPFHIQTSSGAYNASNLYTTGVTVTGDRETGLIDFQVPFSAPNTLYYVCENHSNMAGSIVVYPSI